MTNKNKGIVMETSSKGYVTVMTSQGEFLNIPWEKGAFPTVGVEVEFNQPVVGKGLFRTHLYSVLAASIVIVFLFMSIWNFIFLPQSQVVVAYVNVDINPSMEFGINKKGNVVEVLGLNKDGEELLKDLELIGLSIKEAIEKITVAAIEEKYLTTEKGNTVLITVSSDEALPGKVKDLENKVKNVLRKNNITAEANTLSVSKELYEQAKEENISTGKYVLYMEAVEQGLDISLDDLREQNMKKAVEQAGGVPGQLISNAKKDEKRLEEVSRKIKQRKLELKEEIESKKNEKQEEEKQEKQEKQEEHHYNNIIKDSAKRDSQQQQQPDDDRDDNIQKGNNRDDKNPQENGNVEKKAGDNKGIIKKIKNEIKKRFERD